MPIVGCNCFLRIGHSIVRFYSKLGISLPLYIVALSSPHVSKWQRTAKSHVIQGHFGHGHSCFAFLPLMKPSFAIFLCCVAIVTVDGLPHGPHGNSQVFSRQNSMDNGEDIRSMDVESQEPNQHHHHHHHRPRYPTANHGPISSGLDIADVYGSEAFRRQSPSTLPAASWPLKMEYPRGSDESFVDVADDDGDEEQETAEDPAVFAYRPNRPGKLEHTRDGSQSVESLDEAPSMVSVSEIDPDFLQVEPSMYKSALSEDYREADDYRLTEDDRDVDVDDIDELSITSADRDIQSEDFLSATSRTLPYHNPDNVNLDQDDDDMRTTIERSEPGADSPGEYASSSGESTLERSLSFGSNADFDSFHRIPTGRIIPLEATPKRLIHDHRSRVESLRQETIKTPLMGLYAGSSSVGHFVPPTGAQYLPVFLNIYYLPKVRHR